MNQYWFETGKDIQKAQTSFASIFSKFGFWVYINLWRRFVANPILNTIAFFRNIKSLFLALKMMREIKQKLRSLNNIQEFLDYFVDVINSQYTYTPDYWEGRADFTPYPLIMFMRGFDDDCDGYALMVYRMLKWYGKHDFEIGKILQITCWPQKSVNEMWLNHVIFYLKLKTGKEYIFTSGHQILDVDLDNDKCIQEYMESAYGKDGYYVKRYNTKYAKPNKEIDSFQCFIFEEKLI